MDLDIGDCLCVWTRSTVEDRVREEIAIEVDRNIEFCIIRICIHARKICNFEEYAYLRISVEYWEIRIPVVTKALIIIIAKLASLKAPNFNLIIIF